MDEIKILGIPLNFTRLAIIIALTSAFFFCYGLGDAYLFDWDEINFAEASREMLASKNYLKVQIDYEPFWEKPPLFFWLQVISYKIFGINEFAARFPNAITGILSLLIIFGIGKQLNGIRFGIFWVLAMAGSILPSFYYRTGILDPLLNLLIFLGIFFLYKYYEHFEERNKKHQFVILAGIITGLGILTKGPVALVMVSVSWITFTSIYKRVFKIDLPAVLLFVVSLLLSSGSWFIYDFILNGPSFIIDFIEYQLRLFESKDAGHGGPLYYHFIVLILGCFPASIFIYKSIRPQATDSANLKMFKTWMSILLIWVIIIFSIVQTKIIHYSSLAYFPITFLAAYVLEHLYKKSMHFTKLLRYVFWIIGSMYVFVLISIPILGNNIEILKNVIKDDLIIMLLERPMNWPIYECIIGLILLMSLGLSYRWFKRGQISYATSSLFISTFLIISISYTLFFPRVLDYTQKGIIEFYQSIKGKDVYVFTWGFKSYAQYFYTDKKNKPEKIKELPLEKRPYHLLRKNVEKDVYIVVKKNRSVEFMSKYEKFKKVYESYGYSVFLKPSDK